LLFYLHYIIRGLHVVPDPALLEEEENKEEEEKRLLATLEYNSSHASVDENEYESCWCGLSFLIESVIPKPTKSLDLACDNERVGA